MFVLTLGVLMRVFCRGVVDDDALLKLLYCSTICNGYISRKNK